MPCSQGRRGQNSERCPEVEFAPQTPEGECVAEVLDRCGIWQRAGMSGAINGLNLPEALAGLPRSCDRELARRLFLIAEIEFVIAINKKD